MFDYISKHLKVLKVRQKYSPARRIFNSRLGVWKCGQTRSFVFDILHKCLIWLFIPTVPTRPHQVHFHRSTTEDFLHFQKRRLFHRVKARRRYKEDQAG